MFGLPSSRSRASNVDSSDAKVEKYSRTIELLSVAGVIQHHQGIVRRSIKKARRKCRIHFDPTDDGPTLKRGTSSRGAVYLFKTYRSSSHILSMTVAVSLILISNVLITESMPSATTAFIFRNAGAAPNEIAIPP